MGRYEPMTELKRRRKELGLTQAELAEKAGIAQNTISGYEAGERFPSRDNLGKLAEALDCKISELI